MATSGRRLSKIARRAPMQHPPLSAIQERFLSYHRASNHSPKQLTHYRLTFIGSEATCDCPQATYRGCRCKHAAAVRAALDWLEAKERSAWELEVALRALNVDLTRPPF